LAAALPNPTVVVEVLSPTNTWFDQLQRLEDYQAIDSLQHIVVFAEDQARGQVWSRAGEGWTRLDVAGLDARLPLPAIGIELNCAEVYEGVAFDGDAGGASV
jgi:Uma2 family endonuclease